MQNHASSESEQLLLIKAAAGSGKTYRLTGEYLRLLFSDESRYKHILAVTFTNKATDEMKARIVTELYTLSNKGKSGYLSGLMAEFGMTESQVRNKSTRILENILHDYSSFSISTIDKFFQQTMRAFTREMGLSGGYKLEFDDRSVLSEIIDLMIFELDTAQNKDLTGWILDYMKSEIQSGNSWDVKNSIAILAKELSNEKYKLLLREFDNTFDDKQKLKEYQQINNKIINNWEGEAKSIARKALEIMQRFDLQTDDFKHGRNSGFGSFVKLANGDFSSDPSARFFSRVDNLEDWSTSKSPKASNIESAYHAGLNECFSGIIALYANRLDYFTAKSINRNFYSLGILSDVRKRLSLYQKENNTLFLSDTTELLNKIIADSDAPFVYEKTGSRIQNYMIDEFQDTSSLQWHNFRPLIGESLSNGNFNLVVGDVKQSIYRWRNSDWSLLDSQIENDFGNNNVSEVVLDTNWRSDSNIIQFNNQFFKVAAELLQIEYNKDINSEDNFRITDAYKHVYQLVSPPNVDSGGHVKISFMDDSDKENSWKEQALAQLPLEIENFQRQGFNLKDIAILVRKNSEAVEIAEYLLKYKETHPDSGYKYDIISNEALVIGNAQSVKAAVALLRYSQNKRDDTLRLMAVYEYYRFIYDFTSEEAISVFFKQGKNDFPENLRAELDRLAHLPFYEMIETFFSINNHYFDEKENVYVQAFLDIVLKFNFESSSNANDFLEWWDDKGKSKTLFTPDNQDAIRLMTVHKSKGLGFKVVIVPFMKWDIDHTYLKAPVLWCKPNKDPFNLIDFVPLVYEKKLAETIFKNEYFEEKLFTFIDNLNLIYVAFTRAKKRILGFAPKPKNDNLKDVSNLLWKTLNEGSADESDVSFSNYIKDNEQDACFEFGDAEQVSVPKEIKNDSQISAVKWTSISFDDRLKMKLNSTDFFSDDGNRAYGTLMHDIISEIKTLDEIESAVELKYIDGELTIEEKSEVALSLTNILSNPEVIEWYSGKYKVLNETQILLPNSTFSRPDRVMINDDEIIVVDYKFGEVEESKYNRQIEYYVRNINEMGYDNVKGYLFYVTKGIIYHVS